MDLIDLGIVFFERQEGQLCAQHALNSLLQGQYFSPVDLSQIASDLDNQELSALAEGGNNPPNTANFTSQNFDDSGFFSIQVIQNALSVWNLQLSPIGASSNAAIRNDPASAPAYILNLNEHWLTLRSFGKSRSRWYNLDSTKDQPSYVSEFYLQALLSQLQADGYSVFLVQGVLPESDADAYAASVPEPPPQSMPGYEESRMKKEAQAAKEESKGLVAFSGKGYSLSAPRPPPPLALASSSSSPTDSELEAAIALSMGGNYSDDMDNDLQAAISMSLGNQQSQVKAKAETEEASKRDPEKEHETASPKRAESSNFLYELAFVGISLASAYGLVRLSCAMSISGSVALWLSNGLHTAAIIVSSRHIRIVIPVGFLVVTCLGLLAKFDFQTATILSAVHAAEALGVAVVLYPVYKAKGFQSVKFLGIFLATAFTATLLASICRAYIVSANAPTTQSIPNLLLMDWLATALGYLLIVPPGIGGYESLSWTHIASTAGCAALSIITSFVIQRAQVYHTHLLVAFVQLSMSLTGATVANSFGACVVGICGIVSNLGVAFLFGNETAQNLFESVQASLYIHAPIQTAVLIIAFPMMNPYFKESWSSHKKNSEMTGGEKLAPRVVIATKPIVQELHRPAAQASEDSGELDYLRLACKKIHTPLIKISELSKTGKLKHDTTMKSIACQVDVALAQIEDILFVQKLDAGTIVKELTNVAMSDIISMPVSHALKVFKRRRIRFDQHCDSGGERILVDVPIFQKALLNMLIGPLDHLAIAPERIFLELKGIPDNQTGDAPPQVHYKVTLTICNSSIVQTENTTSLFSDYPVKSDPNGKLLSLGQTLSIARKLVHLLGSKLEIATVTDSTWQIYFTLSCERGGSSASIIPPKIFSDVECSLSRFKTLSLMFPSGRSSKYNVEDTISRSKSENTNDTNSLHQSRGLIAAYQSVEKFKNSGSIDINQDDSRSQSSKRSNASFDSRKSALSSLRRSLSTKNSVFFKKQVHYEDGIGNSVRELEGGAGKEPITGSTDDGIHTAGAGGKKLAQIDSEKVSVSRQVSTNSLSLKVPGMSSHRGPSLSRNSSVRKTGDAFSSGLVQAPITADETEASEVYNVSSITAPKLNVEEAESIVVEFEEPGMNSSPVSRRNSARSLKRHSTGSANQKLIAATQTLAARNLKMSQVPDAPKNLQERAGQEQTNAAQGVSTCSDPPSSMDSKSPSSSGQDEFDVSKQRNLDDWKQGKVLIVDDSSIFRRILRTILVSLSQQIEVIEASNGEEALLVCRECSLNLIFLDFEMPGMNGDEVLRHLRDTGDQTAVVLVTSTTISRDNAIRQAVAEVVPKPVSKDTISGLVKKFGGVPATQSAGQNSVWNNVQDHAAASTSANAHEPRKFPVGRLMESPTEEPHSSFSLKRKPGLDNASIKTRDDNASIKTRDENVASLSLKRQYGLETPPNSAPGSDKLALVVDDSGVSRSTLAKMLKKMGLFHDIVEVSNGYDAVRLCTMRQFSIIFMDLVMPGMNGEEAAARILSTGVETPIVAVTGNIVRGSDGTTLKSVGIHYVLMKPVDRTAANELCRQLLGKEGPYSVGLVEVQKPAKAGLGSMFSKDK
ncbi:Ataxin-3 [Chytriomyces hyalinus]|nr:Ataxin-3 [Chytriomyces hyalinus]